jgi:ribonuclease R
MSERAGNERAPLWVTIDAPATRDVDDAITAARLDTGYLVGVAIADPTGSVPVDSEIDREARRRAASVYSRDRVVQRMLPPQISEAAHSLVEGQPRPALVFRVTLAGDLSVTDFAVSCEPIAVARRLSYAEVGTVLGEPQDPCQGMLAVAGSLGRGLLTRRRNRGALALFDLQRLLYTDEEGGLRVALSADEVTAHLIVQEFMVLANTQLARLAVDQNVPILFRNHEAKIAAPAAAELASTIETWLATGAVDAGTARGHFAALLGRASYGACTIGHYALAEPSYTHGTSPLRRYADLVTLRQIRAWLEGGVQPYTPEALEEIGRSLNRIMEERLEARSQHYKEAVDRKIATAVDHGAVHRLEDAEIARAIKVSAGEALPTALHRETLRRLTDDMATDKVVDTVFAYLCRQPSDAELAAALVQWTARTPSRAVNLLMHAQQIGALRSVALDATGAATAFSGTVTAVRADGTTVARSAAGARKKDAEQAACLAVVAALIEARSVPGPGTSADPRAGVAPLVSGNPKGELLELCQARRWPPPSFAVTESGPPHGRRFACQVALDNGTRRWVETVDNAASKKEAEARASAVLLDALGRAAPAAAGAGPSATASASAPLNPIGVLQEFAQKQRLPSPDYVFQQLSETPPLFRATVTVHGPVAGAYSAEAATKQGAKQQAAARALSAEVTG